MLNESLCNVQFRSSTVTQNVFVLWLVFIFICGCTFLVRFTSIHIHGWIIIFIFFIFFYYFFSYFSGAFHFWGHVATTTYLFCHNQHFLLSRLTQAFFISCLSFMHCTSKAIFYYIIFKIHFLSTTHTEWKRVTISKVITYYATSEELNNWFKKCIKSVCWAHENGLMHLNYVDAHTHENQILGYWNFTLARSLHCHESKFVHCHLTNTVTT
jgi:hypothetical protein